jgi:hypothetical protein
MLSQYSMPYTARRRNSLDRLEYGKVALNARLFLSVKICPPGCVPKGVGTDMKYNHPLNQIRSQTRQYWDKDGTRTAVR